LRRKVRKERVKKCPEGFQRNWGKEGVTIKHQGKGGVRREKKKDHRASRGRPS